MAATYTGNNRHWYGFSLSLLTAILWGVLPISLKLCLEEMDAVTITFYRFLVAGVFVFFVLFKRKSLPVVSTLGRNKSLWLLAASILLVMNYVTNVKGLEYLDPETAQVLMQLAPFLLMLGGVVFFAERLSRFEVFGAAILFLGLMLFFNDRLAELFRSLNDFTLGVWIIVFAAVAWSAYALMQKPLLKVFTAKQLTLLIYLIGGCFLLPFSNLSQLFQMQSIHIAALIFSCLNTILAYGAFTEALNIWHASKVSAVISLAPIFTFLSMYIAVETMPTHFIASPLDIWAYIGAVVVVVGSSMTALGKSSKS